MRISRLGLTLIELLVAIAIIGVLSSLLLVAVQAARASSRRLTCSNNVRQLWLAVEGYHSAHRQFPVPDHPFKDLLVHLDESTERVTSPLVYLCPSDDYADSSLGHVCYRFNDGYAGQVYGANGVMPGVHEKKVISARDITDGLSCTAGMSEKLISRIPGTLEQALRAPLRSYWFAGPGYNAPTIEAVDSFLLACPNARSYAMPHTQWGGETIRFLFAGYNHMLGPNQAPCHPGLPGDSIDPHVSIVPPSGNHSGGVNLVMMDGSVHFFSDGVDSQVWHALGTRAGGESNVP